MVFDRVIAATLHWATPSSGDNLTGFLMDADHAFGRIEEGQVTMTSHYGRLVEVFERDFPFAGKVRSRT